MKPRARDMRRRRVPERSALNPFPLPHRVQVKLLRYNEDTEDLQCVALYHHPGAGVLSLGSCTSDAGLLSTVWDTVPLKRGAVWRMPRMADGAAIDAGRLSRAEPSPQDLVVVGDVPDVAGSSLHSLVWCPGVEGSASTQLLAVTDRGVRVYDAAAVEGDRKLVQVSAAEYEDGGEAGFIGGAAWDPHHAGEAAVAVDGSIRMFDVRSGEGTRTLSGGMAAGGVVRGISYNPNKPWFLSTGGDDYKVKCWDVRKPSTPLKVLEGHAHW